MKGRGDADAVVLRLHTPAGGVELVPGDEGLVPGGEVLVPAGGDGVVSLPDGETLISTFCLLFRHLLGKLQM